MRLKPKAAAAPKRGRGPGTGTRLAWANKKDELDARGPNPAMHSRTPGPPGGHELALTPPFTFLHADPFILPPLWTEVKNGPIPDPVPEKSGSWEVGKSKGRIYSCGKRAR